jgi:hypothetical protein
MCCHYGPLPVQFADEESFKSPSSGTTTAVLRCKEMKPSASQDMIACLKHRQPALCSPPVELQRVPNAVYLYWKWNVSLHLFCSRNGEPLLSLRTAATFPRALFSRSLNSFKIYTSILLVALKMKDDGNFR